MKVKDMVITLLQLDKEKEVYVSVDEEGNDFKPICEVCVCSGEENRMGEKINGYVIYPNG